MKKIFNFVFVAFPTGMILSVLLSVILAVVTFCRTFADYWTYVLNQFFPRYNPSTELEEYAQEESDMWSKHIARMQEKQKENANKN